MASITTLVDNATDEQIRDIMLAYGYAEHTWEDTLELRAALRMEILNGAIPIDELEEL